MRRQAWKLYARAAEAYRAGVHWESGYRVAAPSGKDPCRIAFDAGRRAAKDGEPGRQMQLETWALVLASWLVGR